MIGVVSPGLSSVGAHLVAAACCRAGHHAEVLGTERLLWRPQAIFVSLMCVRQLRLVPATFERLGLAPLAADRRAADPLVVFGGQYMAQPAPIEPFADLVTLGDGELTAVTIARRLGEGQPKERIVHELAGWPGYARPGATLRPVYAEGIEPVAIRNGKRGASTVIEIARGCRRRCLFCTVGWAGGPYREANREAVYSAALRVHRRNVCYFAPDLGGVSWYAGSAVAAQNTARDGAEWIGLDGASERLRRAIGKARSADDVTRWITLPTSARRKAYCVLGLPGETATDREELTELIAETNRRTAVPVDFSLVPLQALPHTPFERISAHHQPAVTDYVHELRRRYGTRDSRVMIFEIKSQESHEHDQCLLRAGSWGADYLLTAPPARIRGTGGWGDSFVRSGRWREHMARYADVDRLLSADCERTWNHVQLTDAARLEAVRRCYEGKICGSQHPPRP